MQAGPGECMEGLEPAKTHTYMPACHACSPSLCIRMQASNLLRALRQSREAAALGLIEGVRGERGSADIEVRCASTAPCCAALCSALLCSAVLSMPLHSQRVPGERSA